MPNRPLDGLKAVFQQLHDTTLLTPPEEEKFQSWVGANNIKDLNEPDSHYDYRGFWQAHPDFQRAAGQHLTDEFKQHGHETFSQQSNYSSGPSDGGMWIGPKEDIYFPQPPIMKAHK